MARQELIQLVDDLDGTADDTVTTVDFGLDGVTYKIDLSDPNASRLRGVFAEFAGAARRTGGRNLQRQHAAAQPVVALRPKQQAANDAGLIREWAQANGIELAARGRIPSHVVESYREAQKKDGKVQRPARSTPAAKSTPAKSTPTKPAAARRTARKKPVAAKKKPVAAKKK